MQPQTIPFRDFLVYYGDGGAVEAFNRVPLAMTTRGFSRSVKSTTVTVPDADNEDLLVQERNIPSTATSSITGKGIVGLPDYPTWEGLIGKINNYRVVLRGVGWWQGPMVLDKFDISATRTNVVETDVSLTQADALVFTPGAPPAVVVPPPPNPLDA